MSALYPELLTSFFFVELISSAGLPFLFNSPFQHSAFPAKKGQERAFNNPTKMAAFRLTKSARTRVPAQATYNLLVDSFCQPDLLIVNGLNPYRAEQLRTRLQQLWNDPAYRNWITSHIYHGQNLNYRRVLMTFGLVRHRDFYYSHIAQTDLAEHLFITCPTLHFYNNAQTLRTILGKEIATRYRLIIIQVVS